MATWLRCQRLPWTRSPLAWSSAFPSVRWICQHRLSWVAMEMIRGRERAQPSPAGWGVRSPGTASDLGSWTHTQRLGVGGSQLCPEPEAWKHRQGTPLSPEWAGGSQGLLCHRLSPWLHVAVWGCREWRWGTEGSRRPETSLSGLRSYCRLPRLQTVFGLPHEISSCKSKPGAMVHTCDSALGRLRQEEGLEFQASLGCRWRPCLLKDIT